MSTSGPESDGERATTLGILVHLLGIFSSFLGTGLVYLITDDEFTKQNARNAFNWQVLFILAFGAFASITVLDAFSSVLIGIVGMAVLFFVVNPAFCVWATIEANRGGTWKYPLAPEFVSEL